MSSSNPRVSIGLPVCNGQNYLEEALDSILAQTYPDFELIISDNASTDRTPQICQSYAAKDSRLRYSRNPENLGGILNYNRTFELSSGEYFKWAAHDDVLAPGFLRECVGVLNERPDVVLVHPKIKIIDEQGKVVSDYGVQLRTDSPRPHIRFHDLIWVRHWCQQVYGVIRRNALKRTRLHGSYASSDRVLLIELAMLGPFYEVPEYLFFARRHGLQASQLVHNLHAYTKWFDSAATKGKSAFPASRLVLEHWRAVKKAPVGPSAKALCYLSGILRCMKYARILSRDFLVPLGQMRRRRLEA